MHTTILPSDWQPIGVDELEDAATNAVTSVGNSIVVAGPGSGKTELLAQRADYLLRTGLCRNPRRILAISFKRDAARNLRERVAKRLPEELSQRLDSWTFDAFSKQLLDRFRNGLPDCWKPSADYEINFTINERNAGRIIDHVAPSVGLGPAETVYVDRAAWYHQSFIRGSGLPDKIEDMGAGVEGRLAVGAWNALAGGDKSSLNFHMIARLVELLLRSNPAICRGLRATYAFVFVDEFQDTTNLQYDILSTAFRQSDSVVTAVGDPKQCIMTWAGALAGVTRRFADEFAASDHILRRNYRSEPELISILGSLAKQIDPGTIEPEHGEGATEGEGECRVFEFPDHESEAVALAQILQHTVEGGIAPRDICLLCRKKVKDYSSQLINTVDAQTDQFQVRDETSLQDLLTEPIASLLADAIFVASDRGQRESWSRLQDTLEQTGTSESDRRARLRRRLFSKSIDYIKAALELCEPKPAKLKEVLSAIIDAFGADALKQQFPQYLQGTLFDELIQQFCQNLCSQYEGSNTGLSNWRKAIESVMGTNAVG